MAETSQILNANEPHGIERVQRETTAGEAHMEAQENGVGTQVGHNVEVAHEAAQQAASSAKMHGQAWTGEPNTAAAQFRHEVTAKTDEAVGQGQHDVEEAKAVGAGYVEQAKTMASNVLATAQSYLPTSLSGGGSTDGSGNGTSFTDTVVSTASTIASTVQSGATTALDSAKEFAATAHQAGVEAAAPHIENAKNAMHPASGGIQPPASSTGIPASSAPLQVGKETIDTPYATTNLGPTVETKKD